MATTIWEDTLEEVIGIRPSMGSLKEYGVSYSQVDLKPDGSFDFEKIREAIKPHTRLIAIQRSKGYQTRPTLSVEKIGEAIAFVKGIRKDKTCDDPALQGISDQTDAFGY